MDGDNTVAVETIDVAGLADRLTEQQPGRPGLGLLFAYFAANELVVTGADNVMVFLRHRPQVVFGGDGGGGFYQVVDRRRGILQFAFDVAGNGIAQNGVDGGKGYQECQKEEQ